MGTRTKIIEKKYETLAKASREVKFEVSEAMGPSVSGVRRSLLIPSYSRQFSSMIRAYKKLSDAPKSSTDSRRFK